MRAYKCDMNINDLLKLREEFWDTRNDNLGVWKVIHHGK